MKLAKSQPNEIQHIKNFLKECGWLKDELKHTELEDVDFSEFELLKDFNQKDASEFLFSVVNEIKALYHEKAMWNLETLLDNCADKSLDYLDFNSNIKAGQEAIELLKELRGFAPYCTDHRQRVDDILSKVSVDMKIIYFQPPGIRPQYCEAGMIHESDTEYIWYLDEPCKILISEVKIIDKENVIFDKKSRLIKIK